MCSSPDLTRCVSLQQGCGSRGRGGRGRRGRRRRRRHHGRSSTLAPDPVCMCSGPMFMPIDSRPGNPRTHKRVGHLTHHIVYSCRPTNTQARRSSVTSPYRILVSTLCTGGGEEPAGQGPGRRSAAAVPGGAQPAAGQRQPGARGRGDTANKHSTDVESPPLPPLVCMSMYTQGKSCSYRHAEDDEDIQRWFECLFSMTLLRGGGRAREVRVRDAVGGADAGDH